MEIWKKIPSWFNLENYRESYEFTAKDWQREIKERQNNAGIFYDPVFNCDADAYDKEMQSAIQFFENLKKEPLISRREVCSSVFEEIINELKIKEYEQKFASVQELSEYQAYQFFIDSDKKAEIENDFLNLNSIHVNHEDWMKAIKRDFEIRRKYSQPILDDEEDYKFLEINLTASDEQILNEFKKWLIATRSSYDKFIKRQLSTKDYQDWVESKLLPYWDLTTIAAIEKATIPYHVLGNALFPDEFSVDLTERIRKITKRKCQLIFSGKVMGALIAQAESERLQRNNF